MTICREAWYYLILLGVVLGGAMIRQVNLLFVLAGMMLGPLVLNARWVVVSLRRLSVERKAPRTVCAGDLLIVQIKLENGRRRRSSWAVIVEDQIHRAGEPTVRPRVFFPQVRSGQSAEAVYRGRLIRRGPYEMGPPRVSTRFPFGLVRRTITLGPTQTLLVCPRLGRLAEGWLARRREAFAGSQQQQPRYSRVEGEFFGVRDWRDGDSRRSIHWRSSARRGGLVVRQFEQPHSRDVAVLVDLWQPPRPGPLDADHVELAVSFAATVAADVCRQGGAELGLGTTDAPEEWTAGPASPALIQSVMERLALVEGRSEDRLPTLLTRALDRVAPGTDIILVSTRPVNLDDLARFGAVWQDSYRRSHRRRIRLVDSSAVELTSCFTIDALSKSLDDFA